jgi:hypothetical protein
MSSASTKQVTLSVPEGSKTIADTLEQGRLHLILGLSPEVNDMIEKLARRYGVDKADIFNRAIGLFNYLSDAAQEGKRVGIATDDQELDVEIEGI